jgi:hypothetical protein
LKFDLAPAKTDLTAGLVIRIRVGSTHLTYTLRGHHHLILSKLKRSCIFAAAVGCILLSLAVLPYAIQRQPFIFDDAYVVFRYALNIRHGLGVAWNPDGVPTYGMPSQLWAFLVLPFTYLPFAGEISLRLASWMAGGAALLVLAITVARNSQSEFLKFPPLALVAVALPLLINPHFIYHLTTGMDTMLSLLANALLILATLEYLRHPTLGRAIMVGIVGFSALAARPENGLCALAAPLIVWFAVPVGRRWKDLVGLLVTPALLAGIDLIICDRYFGVALPLGFPGYSLAGYAGFMSTENALQYAFTATLCVIPFIGVLGGTFKRGNNTILISLILPAGATLLCLLAVRQHMGFQGRFYVPFFPFVIVPALLGLDSLLCRNARRAVLRAACGVAAAFVLFGLSLPLQRYLDHAYLGLVQPSPIAVPSLTTEVGTPLPKTEWLATIAAVGQLVARLPSRLVVAAAEVGFLGYASQSKTVIDLTGVNDAGVGMRELKLDRLLERAPDLIWLPPQDYTGLRAILLSDPRFFASYYVIAGAFNYGIAIRRDSPYRSKVVEEVGRTWNSLYPGLTLQSYVVRNPPTS